MSPMERINTRAALHGEQIRREADRQGITARDLANRLGVSEGAVGRWIAGNREIPEDQRIAVARALGVPVLALFPYMTPDGELVA